MTRRRHISKKEYKIALAHPVFLGSKRNDEARQREAFAPSLQDQSRRRMAEQIVALNRMANEHWKGVAPVETPGTLMMLDLFVSAQTARDVAVGDACIAANVPMTTALRAIDTLLDKDMIVRIADPTDARRKLLRLTVAGDLHVRTFLDALLREFPAAMGRWDDFR